MEEKYVPNYKCRDCKNYGRHNNYCTKIDFGYKLITEDIEGVNL